MDINHGVPTQIEKKISEEDDCDTVQRPVSNQIASKNEDKKRKAIRHAEKRRTSTCRFADRVAQLSVDHYKSTVPIEKRPIQTCIATILAHYRQEEEDRDTNDYHDNQNREGILWIVSMGVGTKFLSELSLQELVENDKENGYGSRVRDMHAEVLARRAFRRQLTLEIQEDLHGTINTTTHCKHKNPSVLVRCPNTSSEGRDVIRYMLRPGVTIHMYTSSAPCGNATLKKFCKMSKERFQENLGPDEWPSAPHDPPPGHSIKLGEFSLLLKKDNSLSSRENKFESIGTATDLEVNDNRCKKRTRNEEHESQSKQKSMQGIESLQQKQSSKRRGKPWPASLSDDWAPPGTTIVGFRHKGSIHTCSDKICRWNYLGIQGSLLASILEDPIYLSTLTVGRKLSGAVCRRAVCCRLDARCRQPILPTSQGTTRISGNNTGIRNETKYRVNHPAVMGTSVYLDMGVVDTSNVDEQGQDVRFHSPYVWSWWPGLSQCRNDSNFHANSGGDGVLECIESSSGLLAQSSEESSLSVAPKVSTKELTLSFLDVCHQIGEKRSSNSCAIMKDDLISEEYDSTSFDNTLSGIREIKKRFSPQHETFKDILLTEHKVLSQWQRRGDFNVCKKCNQ